MIMQVSPLCVEDDPGVLTTDDWLDVLGRSVVNVENEGVGVCYEFRPGALCIVLESVAIEGGRLRLMEEVGTVGERLLWLCMMWRMVWYCTFKSVFAAFAGPLSYYRDKRRQVNGH